MRIKKQLNIEIGEQIKYARERIGITQEQLAERVDVSPQYVSDLERGVVGISIATLKRFCLALGVSSDLILFGDNLNNFSPLAIKCSTLTKHQINFLLDVIDRFTELVASEKTA